MALIINHQKDTVPIAFGGVVENTNGPYFPKYEGIIETDSSDVRWGDWGLDANMNLSRTAADFYLLYDLYIDELDEGYFQELMDYVLPQFVKYTDMALGGEIRHARDMVAPSKIPAPLQKAVKWKIESQKPQFGLSNNRHQAWAAWRFFRKQFGNVALIWAEQTFVSFKVHAFGGPRWANIAKTLRLYVTGEYSPIMFVDTCWGLQHNGGSYFNKAWTIGNLKSVLDANQSEKYENLLPLASPAVSEFYTKVRG
tara:strand:+ start:893 stop:1654 length:762 start_codon:yes stop_codon:yes gene_type:complete